RFYLQWTQEEDATALIHTPSPTVTARATPGDGDQHHLETFPHPEGKLLWQAGRFEREAKELCEGTQRAAKECAFIIRMTGTGLGPASRRQPTLRPGRGRGRDMRPPGRRRKRNMKPFVNGSGRMSGLGAGWRRGMSWRNRREPPGRHALRRPVRAGLVRATM